MLGVAEGGVAEQGVDGRQAGVSGGDARVALLFDISKNPVTV